MNKYKLHVLYYNILTFVSNKKCAVAEPQTKPKAGAEPQPTSKAGAEPQPKPKAEKLKGNIENVNH